MRKSQALFTVLTVLITSFLLSTNVYAQCPTGAIVNEFHYDNGGTDMNEFVEIAIPVGGDPTQVTVTLYNGNGGASYGSLTLSAAEYVGSDATYDYYVWNTSMQNGNDGIAISCADGTVLQFITYEGAFAATDGPASGQTGVDVGVAETSATTDTQAIQFDGMAWVADCPATAGATNECTVTFDCPTEMVNFGDACDDMDATTENDAIQMDCTCAGTTITFDCPATMQNFGDACDDGDATTVNDVVQADCSCAGSAPGNCPAAIINEFHYDNGGTDLNELVEIAIPVGGDPTQITVTLYNGNGGASYGSITLSAAEYVSSDATYDYYVWNTSMQNGNDGIAISCMDGTVLQFITYEGAFMATDGPASGTMGVDVGVAEDANTTDTQSVQFDGTAWNFNCTATAGATNDTSTCNVVECSITNVSVSGSCVGADYVYDVTFTAANGSGNYDVIDVTNGNAVLGSGTGSPISITIAGNTSTTSFDINVVDNADATCAGTAVTVTPEDCSVVDCPALGLNIGDACDDGDATTINDAVDATCTCVGITPGVCPAAIINEFHYDNGGTDLNELVEIAIPVGGDPTQITVTLYNGNGGASYGSITLSAAEYVSSDATYDYYVWNTSMQNGNDGIAISCMDGTVLQFITYEGAFMATDGPASGTMGVDVGVAEDANTTDTQSIQFDGTAWNFNCTATAGATNDTSTCNVVECSITNVSVSGSCVGADYVYDVTFTAANGSGNYDVIDVTNGNAVLGSGTGSPISITIAGNTSTTSFDINVVDNADATCAGTAVTATPDDCSTFDCPALGLNIGDPCDDGDATTINDAVDATCACVGMMPGNCPAAIINEFHYDNGGTDLNELVEIAIPVGGDPTQITVTLYNGNGGASYGSITLSAAEYVSSDATYDYYVWNTSMQNGNDGIAISCMDGTVLQFITYEGAFMATDGPASGTMGVDVGVAEDATTTDTQSIQFDGTAWSVNCTATAGATNDTSSCGPADVMGCTNMDATNFDPLATIDDGTCLYLCDDTTLDISTNGGFDGGTGLSYGLPGGMGLLAGANDDFGGFVWNTNTTGLTNDEICISIDFEVTGDAAGFPVVLEFRIENNDCGFFPCPWNDFNMTIIGPGTYTFGGLVSSGNIGGNGPFDPAGANPAVVAAINNFSGTPLGADVNVVFSNLCVTNCMAGCTDMNACNFDPMATTDDGSCYNVGDACDDGDPATVNDVWSDCTTCTGESGAGCTDPNATNFDTTATTDNGTCLYLCDDTGQLDVSTNGGFDGGTGLSYGSPSGMGLFAGANNDFGGFLWNTNTTGLTNDDFCISIDMEVTGDAAAFPITLEFRIENNGCPAFPCPWYDFNTVITGPGTYTLGGLVSSGTAGGNGPFDPAGMNPTVVAAIANFSGTPLGGDVNVVFSNLCVSTDCVPTDPGCAPSIIQFPANPVGN